jgi:hypothetical protein
VGLSVFFSFIYVLLLQLVGTILGCCFCSSAGASRLYETMFFLSILMRRQGGRLPFFFKKKEKEMQVGVEKRCAE